MMVASVQKYLQKHFRGQYWLNPVIKAFGFVWWTFLHQMDCETGKQIDIQITQINTLIHMWETDWQTDRESAFGEMHLCCSFTWTAEIAK